MHENITVVGCLAHLRRKFFDALKILPKEKQLESNAARAVAFLQKGRERFSRPVFNEFYSWVLSLTALPNTLLGKAVYYAKSQQKYLERYLLDGRLEISNNRAERSIKPFVLGRKNWLFSNTPNGAKASAIYYSLIVTAGENGLNPYEYLSWIFTNVPNLGKLGYASNIDDFLPGSPALPKKIFTPEPTDSDPDEFVWEED